MQTKPIVGLCADRKMLGMHPFHAVGEKYLAAVIEGADAFAVGLPSLGDRQSLEQTLALVDGLVFTGSPSNVEPHHYAGHPSEPGTLHDPHRDSTTLPLIRAAIERGIPVLGICRGFQEMNVVFGGSLFQKVHEQPGKMDHREKGDATLDVQYGPVHAVKIAPNGLLFGWFGKEEAMVNSIHQQGVDRLGEGLQIEATAPDGLIEAFSVRESKTFAFAVQWHPEWKHAENPLSTAIFTAFGAACRQRQQQR